MKLSSRPWRFFIASGLLIAALCGASLWYVAWAEEELHLRQTRQQLLTQACMLRDVARERWPNVERGCVGDLLRTLADNDTAVVLMDTADGVWLDSSRQYTPDAFLKLPEVRAAFVPGREWGADTRPWGAANQAHVAVALRTSGAEPDAARLIWLARPQWTFARHPQEFARLLGTVGGVATVATTMLGVVYTGLRRRVLHRVLRTMHNLSSGDLSADFDVRGEDELVALSSSLRALRRRLAAQVELIDHQRQMLGALVDRLAEGVIVTRADGRIALLNPRAVQLLGLDAVQQRHGTLVGQPVEAIIPHHPLQRLLTSPIVPDPSVKDGASSATQVEIETANGPAHFVARVSTVVLPEPGGRALAAAHGRILMLTDVTELQRIIQMRTDFVANASHELRTPLSTVRAAVETLRGMDLATEAKTAGAFLEKVDRHSARLEAMVSDLLDLSRLETPAERFASEEVDITRLLDEIEARFADRLEAKQLHWQVEREPPTIRTLSASLYLLRLVLDNLVDNAIKFTNPGGRVAVRVCVSANEALVEVCDTGCGIAEEEQQRVFERFYQVQKARSGPERGTGLGLSIVRHAVHALRGTARLESRLGEGTCVSVLIPQAPAGGTAGA